jgi:hypothetical protein
MTATERQDKMRVFATIAITLAMIGSAYAAEPWFPSPAQQQDALTKWEEASPPPPKMESGVLVLALAYARYCGTLQPRVLAAANAAMAKMTPDQRWNIERSSYDNFQLRQIGTFADPPSVRAGVDRMQHQACEWSKAQLEQMTP